MKLKSLIYIIVFLTFILLGYLTTDITEKTQQTTDKEISNLTRIVDGDTIVTDLGKVRLLGVNTPEKNQYYHDEAVDFLNQYYGKQIQMEKTTEDKDMYGRLLRYIFYNNVFINEEIIKNGNAHFYTYNEDKYTEVLRKAEQEARDKQIGIWKKSAQECAKCINLVQLNKIDPGEFIILNNSCNFNCNLNSWRIDDDSSSHTKILDFSINPESEYKISYGNQSVWNDNGDTMYLRDNQGLLVIFYRY